MKMTDVACPICGTVNHDLYLEETDGWMECETCGNVVHAGNGAIDVIVPVSQEMRSDSLWRCKSVS